MEICVLNLKCLYPDVLDTAAEPDEDVEVDAEAPVVEAGMVSWTVEDTYKWLTESCDMSEGIARKFKEANVDGNRLGTFTKKRMKDFAKENNFDNQFGDIILRKAKAVKREETESKTCGEEGESKISSGHFSAKFRDFDTVVTMRDKYRENSRFPSSGTRPGNLVQPVRRYVHFTSLDPDKKEMVSLARETVRFADACLNGRTNGCIYFGVKDGRIIGIPLSCDQFIIEKELSKYLRKSFQESQIQTVMQCVRPIKFVKVVQPGSDATQTKYVLEVEVCPDSALCKDEVFFCKPPRDVKSKNKTLKVEYDDLAMFELREDGPQTLESQKIVEFIHNFKDKLCTKREQSEETVRNQTKKTIPEKEKKKLIHGLCLGEDSLRGGDRYPFLIISSPDENMTADFFQENMSFLSCIPWKAVFDTSADGKVYKYMESKGHLYRNRECEELDPKTYVNIEAPEKMEKLKDDIRQSPQSSWIFLNGSEEVKSRSMDLKEWKQLRRRGCREFVDFYSKELEAARCIFVFVLLSRDYDVMLEVADEVWSAFENRILCIGETSQITDPWMDKLTDKYDVDKDALELRTISGLDWHHISAIVGEISEQDLTSEIKLTTRGGAKITLPDIKKNELADLDILSSKQCEGVLADQQEEEKLRVEKEKHFYRGGCADWWNFYFQGQVCTRANHSNLKQMVTQNLEGNAFHVDEGVGQVTLYHEPGAGGTTSAKHVLWDLREEYRCAEIRNITEYTYEQIVEFHSFKESTQPGDVPKAVLLLLDNPDEEKATRLLGQVKEKARELVGDSREVFCVFLLVLRKKASVLPTENDDFYTLTLKQHLDKKELLWFQKTFKDMLERNENDPKTLVAFNIMKENFDRDYIERTVRGIIQNMKEDERAKLSTAKELKLLKMLSLLNMYDIYQRPVPTSALDHFINELILPGGQTISWGIATARHNYHVWENHLSENIRILLNANSGHLPAMRLKTLCIFHPLMSEAILKVLRDETDTYLSQVVLEVLNLHFLRYKAINAIRRLLRDNIGGILKNRERKPDGKLSRFSPLIQEILEKEGTVDASEVLKVGFEKTEDAYVCQQVARMLIEGSNWDEAAYYAKLATDQVKHNSWLWHTRGQVFRCQLLEKLQKLRDSQNPMVDCTDFVLHAVIIAFDGIQIFKTVQELADKNESSRNLAGQFGEMKICRTLFECLNFLPCFFSGKASHHTFQRADLLKRFLCDPDFVPHQLRYWSNINGTNYLLFLKQLRHSIVQIYHSVDDELTQLKSRYLDRYQKQEHKRINRELETLEEPLQRYLGSDTDNLPAAGGYRGIPQQRIFHLKGMSLGRIFQYGRCENGPQQLAQLLEKANALRAKTGDGGYLRSLIGINLVHWCMFPFAQQAVTVEELQDWAQKLYSSRTMDLEPYLFFVSQHWESGLVNPKEIQDAINAWEEAYFKKHKHQGVVSSSGYNAKPRDVFYVGKGTGFHSVVGASKLRYEVKNERRGSPFFRDPMTIGILRRISGLLDNEGISVKVQVKYKGHRNILEFKLDRPLKNRLYWKKTVNFFLGFSWIGPRAYDVMPGSIQEYEQKVQQQPQATRPQQRRRYNRHAMMGPRF